MATLEVEQVLDSSSASVVVFPNYCHFARDDSKTWNLPVSNAHPQQRHNKQGLTRESMLSLSFSFETFKFSE